MHTVQMQITPEHATEMLKRNTSNRSMRPGHVEDLASAIRRGEWATTHQGIAFAVDGTLVDGQHRLAAIAKAGVAVNCVVTYGLNRDSYRVIDCGKVRTIADRLGMDRLTSDVAHALARVAFGSVDGGKSSPSVAQVEHVLEVFDREIRDVVAAARKRARVYTSAYFLAGAVVAMRRTRRNEDNTCFVAEQISALCRSDYNAMSPVCQTLHRAIEHGRRKKAGATRKWDLAIASEVLMPIARVVPGDAKVSEIVARVREYLRSYLSAGKESK